MPSKKVLIGVALLPVVVVAIVWVVTRPKPLLRSGSS